MKYREYGNTGAKVSQLGFGCMRLPTVDGKVNRPEAARILSRAVDLGVNFFDSAYVYHSGESEEVLGEALGERRDLVYISTKNHYKGDDPSKWREYLDTSLERLGVDYIDFYHIHDLRLSEYLSHLLPNGPMEEARKAKEEGLIRHLCFSSHDDSENVNRLVDTGEFEGILVQYNLFDRHNHETISYAESRGLGVAIMGTVGGGQLIPKGRDLASKVEGKHPVPELAIRYVLSHPGVTVALSGMNSIEMLEENASAADIDVPLGPEENEQIGRIMEEIEELSGLYCTGCNYCMPCESGVDIPANFAALNLSRTWGMDVMAKIQYEALGKREVEGEARPAWAKACVECGNCEGKCPQGIDIPARLKEVDEALSK